MEQRLQLTWGKEKEAKVKGQLSIKLTCACNTANVVGGFLYSYGGTVRGNRLPFLFRFDLAKKVWVQLESPTSIPIRSMHSSTLINDGLYIFGGYGERDLVNSMFRYDVPLNTWEELECSGDIPSSRKAHCTEFFERLNVLLLFGGGSGGQKHNDLYSFSASNYSCQRLETKGENPTGRQQMRSIKVGLKWFILGGLTLWGSDTRLHVLDLASRVPVWSQPAYFGSPPRQMFSPVVCIAGSLIVLSSSMDILDLQTMRWRTAGAVQGEAPPLVLSDCVVDVNGRIYVVSRGSMDPPHFLSYTVE